MTGVTLATVCRKSCCICFASTENLMMREHDLPPHLRESNPPPRPPELHIPLQPPEILNVPPRPEKDEKDERPVDPFLRRG